MFGEGCGGDGRLTLFAPLSSQRLWSCRPCARPSPKGEVMWGNALGGPAQSLGPACARRVVEAPVSSRRAGDKVERREGNPGRARTSPGPSGAEEAG